MIYFINTTSTVPVHSIIDAIFRGYLEHFEYPYLDYMVSVKMSTGGKFDVSKISFDGIILYEGIPGSTPGSTEFVFNGITPQEVVEIKANFLAEFNSDMSALNRGPHPMFEIMFAADEPGFSNEITPTSVFSTKVIEKEAEMSSLFGENFIIFVLGNVSPEGVSVVRDLVPSYVRVMNFVRHPRFEYLFNTYDKYQTNVPSNLTDMAAFSHSLLNFWITAMSLTVSEKTAEITTNVKFEDLMFYDSTEIDGIRVCCKAFKGHNMFVSEDEFDSLSGDRKKIIYRRFKALNGIDECEFKAENAENETRFDRIMNMDNTFSINCTALNLPQEYRDNADIAEYINSIHYGDLIVSDCLGEDENGIVPLEELNNSIESCKIYNEEYVPLVGQLKAKGFTIEQVFGYTKVDVRKFVYNIK